MYPGMGQTSGRGGNLRNSRTTFPDKAARRVAAAERQEAYDQLPAGEKVRIAGLKQLRKFCERDNSQIAELAEAELEARAIA